MSRRLLDVLNMGTQFLAQHHIEQARVDAEVLLSHVLGVERITLYTDHDRPLQSGECADYLALLSRRAERIPVQYLTEWADFFCYRFTVREGVFIPRRDTEVVLDAAMGILKEREEAVVVDLGTGCGNIAISLSLQFPSSDVYAVDASSLAISLARENGARLGASERLKFLEGDLFSPLPSLDSLDLIVSNPPYIERSCLESLPAEVKAEPLDTYYGGEDGLDLIRRIVAEGAQYLSSDGMIAMEVGYDQGERVLRLMEHHGYTHRRLIPDLGERGRVVTARRSPH
ncbi:MAG: hypothetical protein AMJ46_06390 [Latescibacteria bacterium DG_63]|nr:MAG: hypothetical protein AMJ46_06390 [Latescibacteria bacterium DG_63]